MKTIFGKKNPKPELNVYTFSLLFLNLNYEDALWHRKLILCFVCNSRLGPQMVTVGVVKSELKP